VSLDYGALLDLTPNKQAIIIMSQSVKETLNKFTLLMVRQANHELNQMLAVRPEPVEGLVQGFLKI
jgi:hypothetical protein